MSSPRSKRSTAGFTLVELMVALTGGLFISIAVFALARDSGRFYQREARIANATVGGMLGFDRLRTDIARAGFLASPNAVRDTRLCTPPDGTWPAALQNLASIQVTAPATTYAALTTNGRTPPSLLLAGSYSSPDVFPAAVTRDGSTFVFNLSDIPLPPALLRMGGGVYPDTPTMQTVFPATRALRMVQNGRQYYGQIANAVGGPAPTVWINSNPPLQERSGSALGCGMTIPGSGDSRVTINVVNFIQYELRTPQTPIGKTTYADLYDATNVGPGEAGRTELIRLEQDINGKAVDGSEEVVAEYAVDFNLQLTAVTSITGCCDPTLGVIAPTNALFATMTGPVFGTSNTPELIRSVRVRLGVRSREGDRPATIPGVAGQGLFRFDLGGGAFARVRTFQADVALHNQLSVLW